MTKMSRYTGGAKPYSALSIDGEIQHLERVLGGEGAHSNFARTYWRERVVKALETPGLIPAQRARLNRLLCRIDGRSSLA